MRYLDCVCLETKRYCDILTKTGESKHYAFIEFASEDVAKIVAETMDNYLLSGSLLQCTLFSHYRQNHEP